MGKSTPAPREASSLTSRRTNDLDMLSWLGSSFTSPTAARMDVRAPFSSLGFRDEVLMLCNI